MIVLQLRCKSCNHTFSSGISLGAESRPVLGERIYRCPRCHAEASYTKDDYLSDVARA